jgi:hypothetical protein
MGSSFGQLVEIRLVKWMNLMVVGLHTAVKSSRTIRVRELVDEYN